MAELTGRLTESDIPMLHPMMLPTLFAEKERDRQIMLKRERSHRVGSTDPGI